MKQITIAFTLLMIGLPLSLPAQKKDSKVDWDAAYEALLKKDPGVRKKIENGDATKADVIAWLKSKAGYGKTTKPSRELSAFRKKLDGMVKSGKLTRKQADDLYATMAGSKGSKGKPVDLKALAARLRAAVKSGKMTVKEAKATYNKAALSQGGKGRGKGKRRGKAGARPGSVNFYAIVIGRLKSKDIELGELVMDVDYVISDRTPIKQRITGKRIKLVGVAGAFLDKLLQLKRGETFKVRTGDYNPEKNVLGFGYKFQVLERTPPFKPEHFGVPPKSFRGFRGELVGKVIEAAGYEVILQVSRIRPAKDNGAADAESIKDKRIRIAGFYNEHRKTYADLNAGDLIRVSTTHRDAGQDALTVTSVLEKLKR